MEANKARKQVEKMVSNLIPLILEQPKVSLKNQEP